MDKAVSYHQFMHVTSTPSHNSYSEKVDQVGGKLVFVDYADINCINPIVEYSINIGCTWENEYMKDGVTKGNNFSSSIVTLAMDTPPRDIPDTLNISNITTPPPRGACARNNFNAISFLFMISVAKWFDY